MEFVFLISKLNKFKLLQTDATTLHNSSPRRRQGVLILELYITKNIKRGFQKVVVTIRLSRRIKLSELSN